MASGTKEALGRALKKMMHSKPIDKITIKDLVDICGVNRQTFYYHFDDVYDLLEWVFEQDANKVLPDEIRRDSWREDVTVFFQYLKDNSSFALNVYNSHSRLYMLRYYKNRLSACVRSFAELASDGYDIERLDYEFIIEFYSGCIIGIIEQWLDAGMKTPAIVTGERCLKVLDGSIEAMLKKFAK